MFFHVWFAGLATLIERPSRQPELAGKYFNSALKLGKNIMLITKNLAYCATYALDSVYATAKMNNWIAPWPMLTKVLIVISCSVMLHFYKQQTAVLTSWVLDLDRDEQK
jgi:hypothetical protein